MHTLQRKQWPQLFENRWTMVRLRRVEQVVMAACHAPKLRLEISLIPLSVITWRGCSDEGVRLRDCERACDGSAARLKGAC